MKKILSILSVPGSVAEVGIALCYSLFSMLFLMFGYEDYLINRRWIVPAGCFCAIVVFHFLIGMTLGHVSRYFEGHPVLFGEMGCFFGIIYILGEESSWISRLWATEQADIYEVLLILLILFYLWICNQDVLPQGNAPFHHAVKRLKFCSNVLDSLCLYPANAALPAGAGADL